MAMGAGVLGMIFAPFTGGLSLIPAGIGWVAGSTTAVAGGIISSDVGPKPALLAAYLSSKMKRWNAEFAGYSSQTDYEKSLIGSIAVKDPRIVLIVSGTSSMHYVTIVGVRHTADWNLLEAVVLDTDGSLGVISDSDLRYWLDSHGYAGLMLDSRYNTIGFCYKGAGGQN